MKPDVLYGAIVRRVAETISHALMTLPKRIPTAVFFCIGAVTAANAACPLMYCSVDLDFAAQSYSGCNSFSSCIKFSRAAVKWAKWRDGHYSLFAENQPAITDLGILIEPKAANFVRYSRDLTNPVWKKENAIAAKTAVGIDNAGNAATTITATKAFGIVSQTVAFAKAPLNFSLFMRRRTGIGSVSISYDGGVTFMPCALTREFQRFSTAAGSVENLTVAIRLESEGDAIDVDFVQVEEQHFLTSPILTEAEAPVVREADRSSLSGRAAELLNSGTFSFVLEGEGAAPRSSGKKPVEILGGQTAGFSFVPIAMKLAVTHHERIQKDLTASLGWGISPLLAQGSMAKHFKFAAASSDTAGMSFVADGGTIVRNSVGYGAGGGEWRLGGPAGVYNGFLKRLSIWNLKLDDHTLQFLSKVDIPPATITDTDLAWKNLSVRDEIIVNGAAYEVQNGIQKEPVTDTPAAQISTTGNFMKFHLFANNAWAMDKSDPIDGAERVELSGNVLGSSARFVGRDVDSIWIADAIYIDKGDPSTSDWVMLGQIHDRVDRESLGPVFSLSLRSGEYLTVDIPGAGQIGSYPIARGVWYNRIFNLKFNQSGGGYIKVWINGTKVADFHGNTGNGQTKYYYWKYGIYRAYAPEYIGVRYANLRIGTDDLSALIAAPDPIPREFCRDDEGC
jgi:hypothetical protein